MPEQVSQPPASGRVGGIAVEIEARHRDSSELARDRLLFECHRSDTSDAAEVPGIREGILHATPMARRLYQRIGFQDVAPFRLWAQPDTLHL
jgi:hypothetical protein